MLKERCKLTEKSLFRRKGSLGKNIYYPAGTSETQAEEWGRCLALCRQEQVFPTRKHRAVSVVSCGNRRFIVKRHLLWRRPSRYRRHYSEAVREIVSHQEFSRSCDMALPQLYCCIEKSFFGIPYEWVMVMEYLDNYREIEPQETGLISDVLELMFRRGYYHPDFKHGNFLVSKEGRSFSLIDLDMCRTVEKCSFDHLVLHICRYIYDRLHVHGIRKVLSLDKPAEELIEKVYSKIAPAMSPEDFRELILSKIS